MVSKGLIVTVVLDSCHSGSATRGRGGAVKRGIESIDTTQRPIDSLVASNEELAASWPTTTQGRTRSLKPGSGWLLEPQGYTLLAACRAQESAYEYPFNGTERHGALTYWLLDSLTQLGPGLSYKMLHDRILAKVHGQFEQQTPQLQGVGDRMVFGSDTVQPLYAVIVLRVDQANQRVLLGVGQAQSVRKGAQFAIYPLGTTDFARMEQRLAIVELVDLGATESWATIRTSLHCDPIEAGAQAVLFDPGTVRLQRPVRFIEANNLPTTIDQRAALERVRIALEQTGSRFAPLAAEQEPAAFQVAINRQSEYEIWDAAGSILCNLRPTLSIADTGAPTKLAQRLIHLAKYRNVQELDNHDAMSPLARALVVELAGKQRIYDPVDSPNLQPFDDAGGTPRLMSGEWVFVRIKNALPRIPGTPPSTNVLNITVLNLQADWGITQLYPSGHGAAFEPLDPGEELCLPLHAWLPEEYDFSVDSIKVFATVGTTNFRWLELPSLDQPSLLKHTTRSVTADPLQEIMVALVEQEPQTRNLNLAAYPSKAWVTAQVEIYVQNSAET
jgi:hypothetical protein